MPAANPSSSLPAVASHQRLIEWVVISVTALVYLPAVFNDFVTWDDAMFLTRNPRFNPPTWHTVGYYWMHAGFNLYMPVTYTLWAGLARISFLGTADAGGTRLNPYIFHLSSVLLQVVAAAAMYRILCRLARGLAHGGSGAALGAKSGAGPGTLSWAWAAAAGAMLFAVHPLQVESVAFVGTMNTPLAGALLLCAGALYLRWVDRSGAQTLSRGWMRWRYAAALLLFVMALLSKPTAVAGPIILLLLERSVFRCRAWSRSLLDLLPWAAVAVPCALWTRWIQSTGAGELPRPLWQRGLVAADAIGFYLGKLVVPWPMGIDYGRTPAAVLAHPHADLLHWVLAAALLLALAAAWARCRRRIAAAIAVFVVAILPNSGLAPFEFQYVSTVADRYAYLALGGAAMLLTICLVRWNRLGAWIVGLGVIACCIAMTERQIPTWRDGQTMFRQAIAVNPRSWVARLNLSAILATTSPDQAIDQATTAALLAPSQWMTHDNLASLLAYRDPPRAVAQARIALSLNPRAASIYNNLGSALTVQGDRAAALAAFRTAHQLSPDNSLIADNLAHAQAAMAPNPTH